MYLNKYILLNKLLQLPCDEFPICDSCLTYLYVNLYSSFPFIVSDFSAAATFVILFYFLSLRSYLSLISKPPAFCHCPPLLAICVHHGKRIPSIVRYTESNSNTKKALCLIQSFFQIEEIEKLMQPRSNFC